MRKPVRRSRKIGLTQGGRVSDGRAREKWSRIFGNDVFQKLSETDLQRWHVIRENPSREYYHPCSRAEIHGVLKQLPESLTSNVRAIILRRMPKDDAEALIEARCRWSCIVLNAFPRSNQLWFHGAPPPQLVKHDAPWAGSWIKQSDGRTWVQQWTGAQAKRYYLYHVLLHELGHLYDRRHTDLRAREAFAEDFALKWARRLGAL